MKLLLRGISATHMFSQHMHRNVYQGKVYQTLSYPLNSTIFFFVVVAVAYNKSNFTLEKASVCTHDMSSCLSNQDQWLNYLSWRDW